MAGIGHQDIQDVLSFWFGSVEETIIPSEHRARIWFGNNPTVDKEMKECFMPLYQKAVTDQLADWRESAHGCLALVLLYDQFTRHFYRNTAKAYAEDDKALAITVQGVESGLDHELSLIERVFFYFPLLHSEELSCQEMSLKCYGILADLALPETKVVYDGLLRFATHHYSIISQFERFPQRNQFLGRTSTAEELQHLKEQEEP